MEQLKEVEILIGLAFTLFAAIIGVGRWFWGRVKGTVNDGVADLRGGHESIEQRMSAVEETSSELRNELGSVKYRMGKMETRMDTLATQQDIRETLVAIGKVEAIVAQQSTQLNILYKAAWDASHDGGRRP